MLPFPKRSCSAQDLSLSGLAPALLFTQDYSDVAMHSCSKGPVDFTAFKLL